ncbi:hypothetical protein FJ425_22230 [Mesorhizobium sp. B2-7-2]|nr:hypothetical protein FJ425_22230 [Mesorhizobium sp. B2-7-2]
MSELPISPLVGEMSGRTEGGAKERGFTARSVNICRSGMGHAARETGRSWCSTATLCPAGHLPHKRGDQQFRRRFLQF